MATAEGIDNITPGVALPVVEVLQDSAGDPVTSGTTSLSIYEIQDDGSLKSFDFDDNTFKTTSLTTETASLTHRTGNGGATDTGVWTYVLSTTQLAGFTEGRKYLIRVTNSGASPPTLVRMFGYGEAPQADAVKIGGSATAATRSKEFWGSIESGTAQAGASTTITLESGESSTDDFYNGTVILLTGGTGSSQYRQITDYNGTTKVATVDSAWGTNPDSSTTYQIMGRIV